MSETTTATLLVDCKTIAAEYGITRHLSETIMRHVPKTYIGRRVFVRREAVESYLESRTSS